MKDKKIIILGIISVIAVFSLMRGISITFKPRRIVSSQASFTAQKGTNTLAVAGISSGRGEKKNGYSSWGRNPFVLPPVRRSLELTVNGILWDTKEPKAVINGQSVGVGDKISIYTVIKIKEDRVLLSNGIEILELKL
jgi:hypothetical protein